MKVLITGIEGFTGRYLAAALAQNGDTVIGLARHPLSAARAALLPMVDTLYACDLADAARLAEIVATVQPDKVVHMAAIAFVAQGDFEAIYRSNLIGTKHLLEALCASPKPLTSVLLISSANVYGNGQGGQLDETAPPAPVNDYAVSKLAMEYMAKLYENRLPMVIVRPFNYTGVGQSEAYLIPKIIASVKRKHPVISLGNLDVARDFSDVRNVVQYYQRLLACPEAIGQTFNVCTGRAYALSDILAQVRTLSGHAFEVQVNPQFVRENEIKTLSGNPAKLITQVGALPDLPLADTLAWMLQDTALDAAAT